MAFSSDKIKSWLKVALAKQDIAEFAVEIVGNTGKGEGYSGDVVFVHVNGYRGNGEAVEYDFVVKCSKEGEVFRKAIPISDCYLNEIYFYETILPAFNRFEREHGVKEPFNSVPKFYGKFIGESTEVLVLENLKAAGYEMWDSNKPLCRKHLDLIVEEYGKFHAISVTMQRQEPKQYQVLTDGLRKAWHGFLNAGFISVLNGSIEWAYNLLQGIVDETILSRLMKLKDQALDILTGTQLQADALKIIIDGDCWNNNYMHRFGDGHNLSPKVALIDWQIVMLGSPVFDLSYFLLAAISKEDIEDMDVILKHYYDIFSSYVKQLGSDPDQLYPFRQLLTDWKLYGRYGVVISIVAVKVGLTSKDKAVDFKELTEQGSDYADAMLKTEVTDPLALKERMKYIVEYAANNDLLP